MTLKTFITKSEQKRHTRISKKGKLFYAGENVPVIDNPTCQICGRQIKSNTGVIAHHGYKRPGGGWQTASCNGARGLPYEVSCDLLPGTIKSIENFIELQEERLEDFINNPPSKLTVNIGSSWHKLEVEVLKPINFDNKNESLKYIPRSYENEYARQKYQIELNIKNAKDDLMFMKKRLSDWVPLKK